MAQRSQVRVRPIGASANKPDKPASTGVVAASWSYVAALSAVLCWAGALALLLLGGLNAESNPLAPQRVLFYVLVLAGGGLTFGPVEYRMQAPGVALEGIGGSFLLLYTLAFVPPPTSWLLWLPDMPVYLLFIAACFWTASALVFPFVYSLGQLVFRQRARRLDVRRSRRQAHELGLLLACTAVLAALHVLTWVSMLLLLLIITIAELLFLSRVEVGAQ